MKKVILSFLGLVFIASTSCDKIDCKDQKGLKKYIYEDLVQDDRCENDSRSITTGKIKYVKDGKTFKLISFGNGECDNIISITDCPDGKCNEQNAYQKEVDFSIDFKSGEVTEKEKIFLNL